MDKKTFSFAFEECFKIKERENFSSSYQERVSDLTHLTVLSLPLENVSEASWGFVHDLCSALCHTESLNLIMGYWMPLKPVASVLESGVLHCGMKECWTELWKVRCL